MEIITAATIIFTILSPFINAWINKIDWSPKTKSLVAWATAIVLGTLFTILTGGLSNISQALIAIPAIYGYSQAIYQFLVKNIATKFEALTTKGSAVVAPTDDPGTVTITSDATIAAETDSTPVPTPVQITTPETVEIIPDPDVKG